jgi:phage regulator Rha-like protein
MNDLSKIPLTMSTLEIAGLTGKRHDNVLRDADKMLAELGGAGLRFEASYKDRTGRALRLLNLPKRECLILVSGYSVEMRARIIDRWLALEASVAAPTAFPADIAEKIERIFGIERMLAHKVTEIEKAIPVIVGQTVDAAIASDARRAVLDYASVRQLLEEAGAAPKGRKSLNRRIGHRLGLLARSEGGARRCPHTGVWLYPRIMADRFMREEGCGLVGAHNARVAGQGVFPFKKPGAK